MYVPSENTLRRYSEVLVNFALNSGKGMRKGQTVYLATQTPGIPLAKEIYRTVLRAGGNAILNVIEDDFKTIVLKEGSEKQILHFPRLYYRGLADSIDHWVRVLADRDPLYLKGIDPKRIMLGNRAVKPFRQWLDIKEDRGRFTWTLCLYGTEGLARQARMTLREYWRQIERACFLDTPDPVKQWKSVFAEITRIQKRLTALPIERLHVEADGTDLWIGLGEKRRWLGGSGRNIPSFEIFTSPDWRGTQGTVSFDMPLYRYGNIIEGIGLSFKNGVVVDASARKNGRFIREMVRQKNADKVGEFSLTDRRFSRITKFMADSLFDENFGGRHGNMHIALGKAYHDAYDGNTSRMSNAAFRRLGFNDSVEHTDIVAGTDRRVTAHLRGGGRKVIYEGGEFRV